MTQVTLSALANTGSTFTGWSGACTGTGDVCFLVTNGNQSATATFNTTGGGGGGGGGASTWEKTFGGTLWDVGHSVQQTTDGGYIITGERNGNPSNFGFHTDGSVYLIKTDASGNSLWEKIFGIGGFSKSHIGYSVQQTTDGGYIITGRKNLTSTSDLTNGVYLIKTDASGNSLWEKVLEEFGTFGVGYSVQQTIDGGYIITGAGMLNKIVKTDANGNSLWVKTIDNGHGRSVQQTTDGGYIITGLTVVVNLGDSGVESLSLIKMDANGNSLWEKTFPGALTAIGRSVQQTTDSGYIITGHTKNGGKENVYLVKTDTNGNKLWEKTFGVEFRSEGRSVQQTTDGGYIITGYIASGLGGTKRVSLIKTDADGNSLWEKQFGGESWSEAYSVQQTTDGGYIVTGTTSGSFGSGDKDVFLIKTDANGNVQ